MDYRPNRLARALATGRTNLLAFWFTSVLAPHTVAVANRLGRMAWPSPYHLMLADVTDYTHRWEQQQGEREFPPAHWPVDGVFAFELAHIPDWILAHGSRRAMPIIYVGYDFPPNLPGERIDAVLVDFRPAAEAAVRHLLATRRRVAMLCLEMLAQYGDGRTVAYETLTRAAGREPEYIFPPLDLPIRGWAHRTLREYVQAHGCPDAIFCGNDDQAVAAHLALSELGYRVPEDVALVGCDGLEEAAFHVPPLSTIVQPFDEMALLAWQYLQKRIAEPDTPRQYTVLEAKFEPRKSSS